MSLIMITAIVTTPYLIIKTKAKFKIDKNINKLILGHSHSQCSVNDSIFNNSINLSASGESYFFNYQKLKKLISENDQINLVFIEFTNNQIDATMDDWIWSHTKMSYYLQFYSPFMTSTDFKNTFKTQSY